MTLYCLDLLTFSLPRANVSFVSFVFWYSQELSVHVFRAFYGIVVTFETLYLIPTCGSCLAIIVWCSSGERATAESVAEAIAENRAELVHLPSAIDLSVALPSKECPNCDGSGVMGCPDCKHKLQVRISADDIMEPPWKAYNVLRRMDYPYENIAHSMRDPKIAAFWLFTYPQILGGFAYDDDVKQKIWWAYKESMRYDQLRDEVAKHEPGWEHLQKALISLDPVRAKDDPVIVKNVPYYKAKKVLESEVMKLDAPPRPENWGELDLPLSATSWTEEELKDPKKLLEMTTLLNAQREMADKILDAQWEAKWRQRS
ncbi:Heat shock protein DnaJ cysteine-rich domain-containing protein [Dioscorea alata]|uniref:Heat shock protein DnaJ cysteine-rich domain-containing protein n=1 Tax=Dioscorea alata TaxID=55571 RepID=A0ACB7UBS4_DIOAL|nr:Heat shock protein DnaJ cysteine-rich domain-containing protein [Dioscorea alata]